MKTGKGRAGARILVSEGGQIVLDAATGPDGVLLRDWNPQRAGNGRLTYLLLDGPHVAGSGLGVPDRVAQGLTARAYIYTDRPAYRPGHKVAIRGVVREIVGGQYAHVPKSVYRLEVADSRGRLIAAHPVTLSDFGTFHENLLLDSAAPAGTYRVRVFQPGKSDFAGSFEVQSYQLEPISLSFDLKKTVFYRGELIQATLVAKYQYGAPVAGHPIEVQLPDGRILHGTTDQAGQYPVEFPTEGFAEEQSLALAARLPEDNVATAANVLLAIQGFRIGLSTTRDIYLDGESFQLQVDTADAQGNPGGQTLSAAIVKQIEAAGRVTEREMQRKQLTTDVKTGHGSLMLQVDDQDGGRYVVRVAGTDRFGNAIVADRSLLISGKKDETKLRLLADRQRYKVGEEASVNLHSRERTGTALLTWEADRILTYKIVSLNQGNNPLAWVVDGAQFPNFTLTATRMAKSELDQARLDVQVERDLKVEISVAKPTVAPGDTVDIDVTTVDQLGRPVPAELSIAVVDQSLLRVFEDSLPPIGPFFFGQTRTGVFSTEATNTFRYAPPTTGVASALVEERDRLAAEITDSGASHSAVAQLSVSTANMYAMAAAPAPPVAPAADVTAFQVVDGAAVAGVHARLGSPLPGMSGEQKDSLGRGETFDKAKSVRRFGKRGEMDAHGKERFPLRNTHTSKWPIGKIRRSRRRRGASGANPRAVRRDRLLEPGGRHRQGRQGARVSLPPPGALSEYRVMARGITGLDTLAGQSTAPLTVRKSFFVDLKVPASLTQGDKPRFVARVHHTGVAGKLALGLTIYIGGREEVFPKTIEIAKDGVDEVVFDPVLIPEGEIVRLTLKGIIGGSSDEDDG